MFCKNIISWILCIFASSNALTQVNDRCTKMKEESTCMVIKSCDYVLNLINKENFNEARNRFCGYDQNKTVMVCCPNGNQIVFKHETDNIAFSKPHAVTTPNPVMTPSTLTTPIPETTPKPLTTPIPETTPKPLTTPKAETMPNPVTTPISETRPNPVTTSKPIPTPIPDTILNHAMTPKPIIVPIPEITPNTVTTPKSVTIPIPVTNELITPQTDLFPNRTICGQFINNDRIIGGNIAEIDEFPWMVRIKYSYRGKEVYSCGGSLITDRHVLTAAHCVTTYKVLSVRLGEFDTSTEQDCINAECNDKPVDVMVKEVIPHPEFGPGDITRGDIALVVLAQSVKFTDFIQPVCLPTTEYTAAQDYTSDSTYMTAGWGITEYDDQSNVKRKLMLNSVPIKICVTALESTKISIPKSTWPNIICAGGRKSQDSCQGDSGGPLIRTVSENYNINWYLYGITSFGAKNCGQEGIPGVYTRVTTFMDWVREQVART